MDKKSKPRRNSEKRREKSRDAARQRRNQETHIFTELADTLPLAKGKTRHLDKASIMRLTLCLMKQHEIRLSVKDTWQALFEQTQNCNHRNNQQQQQQQQQQQHLHQSCVRSITNDDQSDTEGVSNKQSFTLKSNTRPVEDNNQLSVKEDCSPSREHSSVSDGSLDEALVDHLYAKALDGFVIILSRDGEIADVSEHVVKYLGIQQIDLLGQNIYDYIHPCDHEQLRTELGPSRAHRTAGVDTWPAPRQVFSLRVKSTLTAKGRNMNLKSASYKVIKFSGQLLCPSGDIDTFTSPSTTSTTPSSSTSSLSTVCLPCSSSSPLDKASLQIALAKRAAVGTDDGDDGDDEEDDDDDDDDDVVIVEKKEFKFEINDDNEYERQVIKSEKHVDGDGGGGGGGGEKKNKYEANDNDDGDDGGSGSYAEEHDGDCPPHHLYHFNKHHPQHLPQTSSSLHHHQQQQQSSLSSSSSSSTSPLTIKEEEDGSYKCEAQIGDSCHLHPPPHHNNNNNNNNDDNNSIQAPKNADDKVGVIGSCHDEEVRLRDNQKQDKDEAKMSDSGDADVDREHEDGSYDDYSSAQQHGKISPPGGSPAADRRRQASGSSTENSSGETGRVRTNTAYFVAFGEPIPHPANIEVPLGSQTFLSQHSMDMRFTIWDEKIKELVGYTSEDIIGHSIYEYYHGLDAEMVGQAFKELMTKGQITTGQYRFLAKQGGHVWLITQATVIYDNRSQKPLYVVCVHCVLSEIENRHEILSIVQQPLSSQSRSQPPLKKQSCVHPRKEDIVLTNSKTTNNHNNTNVTAASSSSSSSASASATATRPISADCAPSYAGTESQHLEKCMEEIVVDSPRRSKDGKSSLSSLTCNMLSKSTPTSSSASSASTAAPSSHLLVLSKLGNLVNQREGGPKLCDSGYYGRDKDSEDDTHCGGDDFGGIKELQQQRRRGGVGGGNSKKVKRKATNNDKEEEEEERVNNNNNKNNNNNRKKKNDYRGEKATVKEDDGIMDIVVVGSKGGTICSGSSSRDEHNEEEEEDSRRRRMKWRKKGPKNNNEVVMKESVAAVNYFDIGGIGNWSAAIHAEDLKRGVKMYLKKTVDGREKENNVTGWRKKKSYNGEMRVDEAVIATNVFDTRTTDVTFGKVSKHGAKMDIDEADDGENGCGVGDDGRHKEMGEMEVERMKKGCNNEVLRTKVVRANDFDTGTNGLIIKVSEWGVETDAEVEVDNGTKDEEMDWRKKKKNEYNDGDAVEMKVVTDNNFDIGIRDSRKQANGTFGDDSERRAKTNVDKVVVDNDQYKENENEIMVLEFSASRRKAESERQTKKKMNGNDPTRTSMSLPLPMMAKKKKKRTTTTKTISFVNQSQPVTAPMKDLKKASHESDGFSHRSLGFSLTSADFTVVPPSLVRDDNVDVAVVTTKTADSRRPSPLPGGVASNKSSNNNNNNNRGIGNISTSQQQQYHDRYGSGHGPSPLLNTEKIFAPRTKDMDEDHYNTNTAAASTMPALFIIRNNNNNNNNNNNDGITNSNTTAPSKDPKVTGSNVGSGSTTTNVTNMLINNIVPMTTMLLDEQDNCVNTSTVGCINEFDDLTSRAPSAGDVCIDLSVPPNFETLFKVPSLDVDDTYINAVSMTEMCDTKPQCLQVSDLSSQLQDFNIEEADYDILQTNLTSSNEGDLLLSPDIGDMLYSKNILSFANKSEAGLDKGLMRMPAFNKGSSLRTSPTQSMMVHSSCSRNTSPNPNPSPNTELNIEFNMFGPNKGPMIQQTPVTSLPNPNGNLQGDKGLKHTIVFSMSSPPPPPMQQMMMTEQPRTMVSNVGCNTKPEAEELLLHTFALNKEAPPVMQQRMMTEEQKTTMVSSPTAANPDTKLQVEKLLKRLLALNESSASLLSEELPPPPMMTKAQIEQPSILKPNPDPSLVDLNSNSNQTLLHGKELSVQPVVRNMKGPTPGKVRKLEPILTAEELREGGVGSGSAEQGFGWSTAQTRQLINEYGSSSTKDSVLRNLLVSGEDRNNGYFVNQHIGLPYYMQTQTQTEPPPKLDSYSTPVFVADRPTSKNSIGANTVTIGNHHDDDNNNNNNTSTSPGSVKCTTDQQKQQDWVWWWALNTTVTPPTLTGPSSIITTSSSTSSKNNVRVSNSAMGTTTNVTSPLSSPVISESSPYDVRALFGEDLVGDGQLDQRTLNTTTRVSNSVKGTSTTSGTFLPNSTLSESSDAIRALFGEGPTQTEQMDLTKGNTSYDVANSAEATTTVTGTTATPAVTTITTTTTSSSSSNSSGSGTRRLSSNLYDDIRAMFGVDLIPGGQKDLALSNIITRYTNSPEDPAGTTTTTLSNVLPNAKSPSPTYDIRTLFGVDLIPAGQPHVTNTSNKVSNSGECVTSTTNDEDEDGNGWTTSSSSSSTAISSPLGVGKDNRYMYNDNDDNLFVTNGDGLSLHSSRSSSSSNLSITTDTLSEAECSPIMSPRDMIGIQNKNNHHNSGIQIPNTQSSTVLQNRNNNNMKYGVKMPKAQASATPHGLGTGFSAAPKWLPRLKQIDCEVNAPVWSGDRLLNGKELLRALDVENIF